MKKKINLKNVDAMIFDFDGVLTDNKVLLNDRGEEFVRCNRSDGLALNALTLKNIPVYILSSEKNGVVTARGRKLKIPVIQGVNDKLVATRELSEKYNYSLDRMVYIGNDLNDYNAMNICGHSVCPSDSHKKIKNISDFVLVSAGGEGVVMEIIEDLMELDLVDILYNKTMEKK